MGTEQILIELHENNILKIANIIDYCFRWLGWTIIKILASIVNGIEIAVNKIYTLNDFFSSDLVTEFINKYKPLIWTILAISIVILGYRIIFNKIKNREHLPSNLIFSILIVVLLPTFMIKLNEITQLGIEDVKGYSTSANELVKNNLFDLYYLDKNGFDLDKQKNNLKEDKILSIDINEKIDDSKVTTKGIFNEKVTMNDTGEMEVIKLDKGWFKLDEQYYRFNIDFTIVIISLGATGITLLCVALKVARLLFELAFNKIFVTLFAFADIDDGKKIREIFKNILAIFSVLFATAIMIKLYVIFTTWLGSKMGSVEVGLGFSADNLAKIIVQIGASIAVIDGPNIIEKILGIDAGLRGGFGTVKSAYGVAKGLGLSRKTISSGGKLIGKTAGASATIGAGILGGISRVDKGKTSLLQEKDNLKNNSNIKDNNLQNEMNSNKNINLSNMDNKNNSKKNIDSENQQNNTVKNNGNEPNNKNTTEIEVSKSENEKLLNCDRCNKTISLENQMKETSKSNNDKNGYGSSRLNDKINKQGESQKEIGVKEFSNDANGYKGISLGDEIKNKASKNTEDSNNSLNNEINKQGKIQQEKDSKDFSNHIDGYKNNRLSEQMKNNSKDNNSKQQINNNAMSRINGHEELASENGNNFNCGNEFANIDNLASNNKMNSIIDQVENKDISNSSSELKSKNNNEVIDSYNKYNGSNILNNYITGKINSNAKITSVKRSYNLGKNITSKWDLPKKINNLKSKKGKENNAI